MKYDEWARFALIISSIYAVHGATMWTCLASFIWLALAIAAIVAEQRAHRSEMAAMLAAHEVIMENLRKI